MRECLMLYVMIFLHIFADYNLQGILASMKQKSWWRDQVVDLDKTQYKNDYKVALLCHAFQWSFTVTIPFLITAWAKQTVASFNTYAAIMSGMTVLHYIIDDLKANEKIINLRIDQLLHLVQIILAWIIWHCFCGWWWMV